jgi:hypothetical protein
MPRMSILGATQLTAWATLALAILALLAAIVAGAAWRVQAKQLSDLRKINARQLPVLEAQLDELKVAVGLRERQERERHEQFVTQVFCWNYIGPDRRVSKADGTAGIEPILQCITYVQNAGAVPVYGALFETLLSAAILCIAGYPGKSCDTPRLVFKEQRFSWKN